MTNKSRTPKSKLLIEAKEAIEYAIGAIENHNSRSLCDWDFGHQAGFPGSTLGRLRGVLIKMEKANV